MKTKLLFLFICLLILPQKSLAQTKEARIFAVFTDYTCDEIITRMQDLSNALHAEPKSKGHVIIYEGKKEDHLGEKKASKYYLPKKDHIDTLLETLKRRWGFFGFPSENLTFVFGGFRPVHQIQFWVVPFGAAVPKPMPTLKKIKYGKGKARDICDDF